MTRSLKEDLERVERHVREGSARVARMRDIVDHLESVGAGRTAARAREHLATCEMTLSILENFRDIERRACTAGKDSRLPRPNAAIRIDMGATGRRLRR